MTCKLCNGLIIGSSGIGGGIWHGVGLCLTQTQESQS